MTDYSTSKFENALAEAGWAMVMDGFAMESTGDVEVGPGAYDMADVGTTFVIIRTDSQGFVWLAESDQSLAAIRQRWDHIVEQLDKEEHWRD